MHLALFLPPNLQHGIFLLKGRTPNSSCHFLRRSAAGITIHRVVMLMWRFDHCGTHGTFALLAFARSLLIDHKAIPTFVGLLSMSFLSSSSHASGHTLQNFLFKRLWAVLTVPRVNRVVLAVLYTVSPGMAATKPHKTLE